MAVKLHVLVWPQTDFVRQLGDLLVADLWLWVLVLQPKSFMTSSSRKQRSPRSNGPNNTVFGQDAQVDARAQLFLGLAPHEIAERTEREKRLRNIMASAEGRAQEILAQHGGNASAQKAILNLRHQLVEEAHNVMYPSISREELQQRRQTFGNVKWTEDAMQRLCSFSPLVEVGAGEGQWQAELRRRGADVIAFDNHSSPSRFGDEASSRRSFCELRIADCLVKPFFKKHRRSSLMGVTKKKGCADMNHPTAPAASTALWRIMVPGAEVQRADAEAAMSGSVGRTLLLVYPPPGDMASRCLSAYGGETLIYVGEGMACSWVEAGSEDLAQVEEV
eukprot:g25706.t1